PLALTLPSTRPKTTRSPATMSAWITPLAPTVSRLPVNVMLPSNTPSRKKSSSPVTSPRMQIPLPTTVPELFIIGSALRLPQLYGPQEGVAITETGQMIPLVTHPHSCLKEKAAAGRLGQ